MRIDHFSIENYKCFSDEVSLELNAGFNIVSGKNNAGKTAFLEALSLAFEPNPHRSLRTVPAPAMSPAATAKVRVAFSIGRSELAEVLSVSGAIYLPLPLIGSPFASSVGYENDTPAHLERFANWVKTRERISVKVEPIVGPGAQKKWRPSPFPSWQFETRPLNESNNNAAEFLLHNVSDDGTISLSVIQAQKDSEIGITLARQLAQRTYRFSAERFNVGTSPAGTSSALRSDAGNLAEVLTVLFQSNPHRAMRLNELVRRV